MLHAGIVPLTLSVSGMSDLTTSMLDGETAALMIHTYARLRIHYHFLLLRRCDSRSKLLHALPQQLKQPRAIPPPVHLVA